MAYNPECLADRVEEARAAARFASIEKKSAAKRAVTVPGHDGRRRVVYMTTTKIGWTAVCAKARGSDGPHICPGNVSGVCYHAIAALIAVAAENGYDVKICSSVEDAQRAMNLLKDPILGKLSNSFDGSLYAVVYVHEEN